MVHCLNDIQIKILYLFLFMNASTIYYDLLFYLRCKNFSF
jgi:hypothetical protein